MSSGQVKTLMKFNDRGDALPSEDFLKHLKVWDQEHPDQLIFGPIIKHTWQVDGQTYERLNPRNDGLWVLPDAHGLLLCEKTKRPDNLLILDAYGKERMRLRVPWQMTGATNPECGQYPTRFEGWQSPYPNLATGEVGKFGVQAYVEGFHGQAFYFELDYHTGTFLWCYRLERG